MLVSAAEPILHVTSNSLFAFVFCNLIVLVIFLGSKFGSTESGTGMPLFGLPSDVKQSVVADVDQFRYDQFVRPKVLEKVAEVCHGEINREEVEEKEEEEEDNIIEWKGENENERDDGEDVKDEEEDNGDDQLRRRIEDFIARVNREWEAENLKERMLRPANTACLQRMP